MFRNAKQIGFKNIGFGSDIITDPAMLERINDEFVLRTKWFTPAEILRQVTANNGKILAMSGPRRPCRSKIGVIEEGALVDLLLIDGNPLDDISILTKYKESLLVIMKDGQIYKNTLGVH
jgi:imidazolonepropionase-like amidohydrolase